MTQPNQPTNEPTSCRVLSDYTAAYPDPIVIHAGDRLAVEDRESEWPGWTWCIMSTGESRWVPDCYLQRQGAKAIALYDYEATELTVQAGETVVATHSAAGWHWCTNAHGDSGWVPDEHLACSA